VVLVVAACYLGHLKNLLTDWLTRRHRNTPDNVGHQINNRLAQRTQCLNWYWLKLKLGRQIHVFGCFLCGCNFRRCTSLACWCLYIRMGRCICYSYIPDDWLSCSPWMSMMPSGRDKPVDGSLVTMTPAAVNTIATTLFTVSCSSVIHQSVHRLLRRSST